MGASFLTRLRAPSAIPSIFDVLVLVAPHPPFCHQKPRTRKQSIPPTLLKTVWKRALLIFTWNFLLVI